MQFPLRASCFEFGAQATPERIGDCRTARAGDLRVGHHRTICQQAAPIGGQKGGQIGTAYFLLSLEEADEIDWQRTCRFQERLDRFDVDKHLSLVVARASPIDVVSADNGIEGWRAPFRERFGRLDVVVAINENRGSSRCSVPAVGADDWVAVGRYYLYVFQTYTLQVVRQPCRAFRQIFRVLGLCTDTGKADELCQLRQKACTLALIISESTINGVQRRGAYPIVGSERRAHRRSFLRTVQVLPDSAPRARVSPQHPPMNTLSRPQGQKLRCLWQKLRCFCVPVALAGKCAIPMHLHCSPRLRAGAAVSQGPSAHGFCPHGSDCR